MRSSELLKSGSDERAVLVSEHVLFLELASKKEALRQLISCMADSKAIDNVEEFEKGIFHREDLMSTGIGYGIAVPHVRLKSIKSLVMSVGICRVPVRDYKSMDDIPITLIFMIAAGVDQHGDYLGLLSKISTMVRNKTAREEISRANSAEEVCRIINSRI